MSPPRPASRRRTLAILTAVLPGVALGCVARQPPDRRLRVPLARIGPTGRLEIEHAGEPAVLVRTAAGGVVARSLLCSHFGCRVQWEADKERYHCPCHEGTFDGEGRLLGGPPIRPPRAPPAEVSGLDILVGER
jgi:cytochrome b6-f complex iron-sulfur subunit